MLVRDEDGRPLYWQGLTVDITDIKRALEREQEATQRLRALDQMKNTFLDAVSHELRTPLAAIVGIGLTLEHKADNLADVDRSDLYTRLVANARKLDRLLNDLLDLDRLTHGIVAPKRRPTDVAALAARIADDWGLLNGRRPEVVAQPVTVSLDPAKVERIIENLLANTARHTPRDTPVWVRVERPPGGDGVLLAVEDAGAGVPAELRDSVFEPFRQGPDTPTHAPGVGIGLTLVARFAELHGGRAWVEERPGRRLLVPGPDPRRPPGRLTSTVILLSGPTHRHGRAWWSERSSSTRRTSRSVSCRCGGRWCWCSRRRPTCWCPGPAWSAGPPWRSRPPASSGSGTL